MHPNLCYTINNKKNGFYNFEKTKIFQEKIRLLSVDPKIEANNNNYRPAGGDKPIFNEPIQPVIASPRIESKNPGYIRKESDKKVNELRLFKQF